MFPLIWGFTEEMTYNGYIDHHVKEEEEEMFPKCRKSKMDLADLAAQLAERKAQLLAEAGEEVAA